MLVPALVAAGWLVTAVSRRQHDSSPQVQWIEGDFHAQWDHARRFDAVFSCGPLNHFVRWFGQGPLQVRHLVAFSSTSALVKQDSAESAERDMAQSLACSEQALLDYCAQRKVLATILRPTLIWGAGKDMNVSRIARLGSRRRFFLLPSHAVGLRQPVHVQDLALAASTVVSRSECAGKVYDLPGGETISYIEMVRRIQHAVPGCTPLLRIPVGMLQRLVTLAQRLGHLKGLTLSALVRMEQDLVFDIGPAQRDFGYAPRGFAPSPAELGMDQ